MEKVPRPGGLHYNLMEETGVSKNKKKIKKKRLCLSAGVWVRPGGREHEQERLLFGKRSACNASALLWFFSLVSLQEIGRKACCPCSQGKLDFLIKLFLR